MPYTLPENVRRLVATTLTDAEIASLVEESDSEVDRLVEVADAADPLIRKLSTLITAKTILGRDPSSFTVDSYSETNTVDDLDAERSAITRLLRRPSVKAASSVAENRRSHL